MAEQASPVVAATKSDTAVQQDSEPQTILILGVLGIPLVVTAPIAWYLGSQYIKRCKRDGRQPDSTAETGRILGMVMTIVWGSLFAMYVLLMVVMVAMMVAFYVLYIVFMLVFLLGAVVIGALAGV